MSHKSKKDWLNTCKNKNKGIGEEISCCKRGDSRMSRQQIRQKFDIMTVVTTSFSCYACKITTELQRYAEPLQYAKHVNTPQTYPPSVFLKRLNRHTHENKNISDMTEGNVTKIAPRWHDDWGTPYKYSGLIFIKFTHTPPKTKVSSTSITESL